MRKVTVAAVQMACVPDAAENRRTAETMVRRAAADGAQIILLPELFENPYFCQERRYASYDLATTPAENPAIQQLRRVAAELNVVLPVSFYEKAGNVLYNSVAIIDADGTVLGIYRKTHIPDDHFYQEKFYFTPGDTGFKVWNTRYAKIGVGICWDQWFPEAARCMALAGAELLFYPTAIGSEPILEVDSAPPLAALYAGTRCSKSDAGHCGKPHRHRDDHAGRREPAAVLGTVVLRHIVSDGLHRRCDAAAGTGRGRHCHADLRPG